MKALRLAKPSRLYKDIALGGNKRSVASTGAFPKSLLNMFGRHGKPSRVTKSAKAPGYPGSTRLPISQKQNCDLVTCGP